jgi:membrane protease subunit HflC
MFEDTRRTPTFDEFDQKEEQAKTGKKKKNPLGRIFPIAMIVIIFIIGSILFNMVKVVTYPDEFSVIKQFGQVVSIRDQPGLSFKMPFIQSVEKYPSSVQFYDIPVSTITTSDKKQLIVDAIITWEINDLNKFLSSLRGSISEAENRLSTIAYEQMKAVTSATTQEDIISSRDILGVKIYEAIQAQPNDYGVHIIRIETKRLDLPDENKEAVYNRMISERQSIATQYRSDGDRNAKQLRNETDRDITIMLSDAERSAAESIARGEAAYMAKMAEAYSTADRAEFYAFLRALEGLEASLNATSETKIVLGSDSPLVDALNNRFSTVQSTPVIPTSPTEDGE